MMPSQEEVEAQMRQFLFVLTILGLFGFSPDVFAGSHGSGPDGRVNPLIDTANPELEFQTIVLMKGMEGLGFAVAQPRTIQFQAGVTDVAKERATFIIGRSGDDPEKIFEAAGGDDVLMRYGSMHLGSGDPSTETAKKTQKSASRQIVINRRFVEANPGVGLLLETSPDIPDKMVCKSGGASCDRSALERIVDQWIMANRSMFDSWVRTAAQAMD